MRAATHAGLWYSADPAQLRAQVSKHLANSPAPLKDARVLVGPHAGYTYCGPQLGECYGVWDPSRVKTLFILGPSHHVYFKNKVLLLRFSRYATPLGSVKVATEIGSSLAESLAPFQYMLEEQDEDEHLFEMHLPYVVQRCAEAHAEVPAIVPIMVSALSQDAQAQVAEALAPYLDDPTVAFSVLLDFCHWGRRFGYIAYVPGLDLAQLANYRASVAEQPIHKSIEVLDRAAMATASLGLAKAWAQYIAATGNTICGQLPLGLVLQLLERAGKNSRFEWIGYSQSGQATSAADSSVSYASGYVRV